MKGIIAIIPARTGSTRVPNKNFKDFCGKPLLQYSVDHAVESKCFDRIVVSTNHPHLNRLIPERYHSLLVQRPESLCTSNAKGYTYVNHALSYCQEQFHEKFSHFMVLPPTSPLRNVQDIQICKKKLYELQCDSVVSMVQTPHMYHGVKQKVMDNNENISSFFHEEGGRTAFQDLPTVYVRNCAIYASKIEVLKDHSLIGKKCKGYVMPTKRSVDINELIDFEFAEHLYLKSQSE